MGSATGLEPDPPRCPSCSGRAVRVQPETVRALVRAERTDQVAEESYLYCPSPTCDVVYSSPRSSASTFLRSDFRVRVGEKESTPPNTICYCFDWTLADIRADVERNGKTSIPDRIKDHIQRGFCRCETMNPRGTCCLGAVHQAVDTLAGEARDASQRAGKATGIAAGGALLMAVLASACCWLPLMLVSLGLSSLGVSAFFGQYRPYLLPLTFALLAAAWFLAYRVELGRLWTRWRRGTREDGTENPMGNPNSGPETCCQTQAPASLVGASIRRSDMKRLRHLPLWLSTAIVLAFASFPRWSPLVSAAGPAAATAPAAEKQRGVVVLGIEGMTCGGCATSVETALKKVSGVRTVAVSYEKGQAEIAVDPSVRDEDLVKAVEGAGFRVVGRTNSTAVEKERPATSASLTILKGSLAPLVEQFNADKGKPRVLALLSPT